MAFLPGCSWRVASTMRNCSACSRGNERQLVRLSRCMEPRNCRLGGPFVSTGPTKNAHTHTKKKKKKTPGLVGRLIRTRGGFRKKPPTVLLQPVGARSSIPFQNWWTPPNSFGSHRPSSGGSLGSNLPQGAADSHRAASTPKRHVLLSPKTCPFRCG